MTHDILYDNCIGTILVLSLLLSSGFLALFSLGAFWAGATVTDFKHEVMEFCWLSFGCAMFVMLFLFTWGAVIENRLIGRFADEPAATAFLWFISMGGVALYLFAPFWGYRSEKKKQKKRVREEARRQLQIKIDKMIEGARVECDPYPGTNWYVYLWTPDGQEHRVCTSTNDLRVFALKHPDASATKPESASSSLAR